MRKQLVTTATRAEAQELCPWAAEILDADAGAYWCFESVQDAEIFNGQL